jgi:hypothetical protein
MRLPLLKRGACGGRNAARHLVQLSHFAVGETPPATIKNISSQILFLDACPGQPSAIVHQYIGLFEALQYETI